MQKNVLKGFCQTLHVINHMMKGRPFMRLEKPTSMFSWSVTLWHFPLRFLSLCLSHITSLSIATASMPATYASAIFAVTPADYSYRFRFILIAAALPFLLRVLIYMVKFKAYADQEQENLCDKCRVGIIIYAENVEVRFPKKTWEVEKFSTHNFLPFFVTIVT